MTRERCRCDRPLRRSAATLPAASRRAHLTGAAGRRAPAEAPEADRRVLEALVGVLEDLLPSLAERLRPRLSRRFGHTRAATQFGPASNKYRGPASANVGPCRPTLGPASAELGSAASTKVSGPRRPNLRWFPRNVGTCLTWVVLDTTSAGLDTIWARFNPSGTNFEQVRTLPTLEATEVGPASADAGLASLGRSRVPANFDDMFRSFDPTGSVRIRAGLNTNLGRLRPNLGKLRPEDGRLQRNSADFGLSSQLTKILHRLPPMSARRRHEHGPAKIRFGAQHTHEKSVDMGITCKQVHVSITCVAGTST